MREPDSDAREGRNETPLERVDRNMTELLTELRVALPGVQVLFAFLLVLPFNQRFTTVTSFQKGVYLVTLLATALATVLLIAPTMHHRIQFRRGNKPQIMRDANRLAIAGISALALATTGTVVLVTDYVFGTATMLACAGGVVVALGLVWYVLPARRLLDERER